MQPPDLPRDKDPNKSSSAHKTEILDTLELYGVPPQLWESISQSKFALDAPHLEHAHQASQGAVQTLRVNEPNLKHMIENDFEESPHSPPQAEYEPPSQVARLDVRTPSAVPLAEPAESLVNNFTEFLPRVTPARRPNIDFKKFTEERVPLVQRVKRGRQAEALLASFQGDAREWVLKHIPDAQTLSFNELVAKLKKVPSAPSFTLTADPSADLGEPCSQPSINFKQFVDQRTRIIEEKQLVPMKQFLIWCFIGEAREWVEQHIPRFRQLHYDELASTLAKLPSKPARDNTVPAARDSHNARMDFAKFVEIQVRQLDQQDLDSEQRKLQLIASFSGEAREWVLKHVRNPHRPQFDVLVRVLKQIPPKPNHGAVDVPADWFGQARSRAMAPRSRSNRRHGSTRR